MHKRRLMVVAAACLVAMAGCGGGSASPGAATKGPEVMVKDTSFRPARITVKAGSEVSWAFEDKGITHNVTAADGSFRSPDQAKGVFAHKFTTPGTVRYGCTIHPARMQGEIAVRAEGP